MQGTSEEDYGLIPQSLIEIFRKRGNKKVFVSFIEIRDKEKVTDLLSTDPDKKESKIYETREGQKYNPPLVELEITNEELILAV